MEKRKIDKDLLEEIHKEGLMYLIIASLFSADSLTSFEICERNLKIAEEILEALPDTNIEKEAKEKYIEEVKGSIDIIKRDMEIFKQDQEKQ